MATAPSWITTPNLGAYPETHSFDIYPIIVEFFAVAPASVTQINGALPDGLRWSQVDSNVEISGTSMEIFATLPTDITLRVTDANGVVADRTYYLTIEPVLVAPDWAGQFQSLGYAASGGTSTYTVKAHTTSTLPISYSIAAFTPPQGLSIASNTGVITYVAPAVTADQTTAFSVRATTGSAYSDLPVTIDLLTVPHAPVWYTTSGLIAVVLEGDFLELDLVAYDSSGAALTYALVYSIPTLPFSLTSSGLLYGQAPTLYTTTVYQFTVSATSINGSVSRTFDVIASPVTVGALLYWVSPADIGTVSDGQFVTLAVSAYSSRAQINYSVVGGILPRGLVLSPQSGYISGFAEFQTRDRSYTFDIQAADEVQTIVRQFTVTIIRGIQYQYLGITVPLEGGLKDSYYQYASSLISNNSWVPNTNITPQSLLYPPYVQLINGLNYAIDNPAAALAFGNLHLNTSELMIGATYNVNVSSSTTLFYNTILDADAGAAVQYMQADNVTVTAYTVGFTTSKIQLGSIKIALGSLPTWISTVVPGTQVRLVADNYPNAWMQGPVTMLDFGLQTYMTFDSTLASATGLVVQDNQWQLELAPTYPPSLVNIRNDLIAGLGWVNDGQGSGAQLLPLVDPTTNSVLGAEIVSAGSGYLYGPTLAVNGTGNGAVLGANLTVVTASIRTEGSNWIVGQQIQLPQQSVSPAVFTVTDVGPSGSLLAVSITDGGEYAAFPAGPTIVTNGNGAPAELYLSLGIGNVWVGAGGSNYMGSGTTISTVGSELLPSWQSTWQPYITVGTVYTEYGGKVVGNETADVTAAFYYQRWPLQHAIIELQGVNWIGDTTFDQLTTSFDGGSTYGGEWLEPRDTIFEQDLTIFDQTNTRFDDDYAVWQDYAYYAWGNTLFDQESTVFDLYSTIFDTGSIPTQSLTLLRQLLRITTQQISGHNVVV